jgi:FkbM family methyltransferase
MIRLQSRLTGYDLRMFSGLHQLVRKTPWLGRTILKAIPDVKWNINVEPIGRMAIRLRQHRLFWLRPHLQDDRYMFGALQRLVHKGDVVYDLGANIGLYSRFFVQCCGAAQVYAFEPMANNRQLLAENIAIGGCSSQATVLPYAVGNVDGTLEFQVDDLTSNSGTLDVVTGGRASQSRAQYGLPPRTVFVHGVRLDTLVQTGQIPVPNVIKLDIEGAEALALEGAQELLSRQISRIALELHGSDATKNVLKLLWQHGYHCFGRLLKDGVRKHTRVVEEDLHVITGRYSLYQLFASPDPGELIAPIQEYPQGTQV